MESVSKALGGLLTTKEVALKLGVSVAKVHRLVAKGILVPTSKVDGLTGTYYFDEDGLPDLVEPDEATA